MILKKYTRCGYMLGPLLATLLRQNYPPSGLTTLWELFSGVQVFALGICLFAIGILVIQLSGSLLQVFWPYSYLGGILLVLFF